MTLENGVQSPGGASGASGAGGDSVVNHGTPPAGGAGGGAGGAGGTAPPAPIAAVAPPSVDDDDDDIDEGLNAAGRRAVQALRRERRQERQNRRQAEAQVNQLQQELQQTRAQLGSVDGLRRAVVEQGLIAAAAGRMQEPRDAVQLINLSDIKLADDGTLPHDTLRQRVDELLKAKPYLGVGGRASAAPPRLPGGGAQPGPSGSNMTEMLRAALRGD